MALVGLNKGSGDAARTIQALKQQEESFTKAHAEYMRGRSIEQMKADAARAIESEKAILKEQQARLVTLNNAIKAKEDKAADVVAQADKLKAEANSIKSQAEQKLVQAEAELTKAKQKLRDAEEKEAEALSSKKAYEDKLEEVKKALRALV